MDGGAVTQYVLAPIQEKKATAAIHLSLECLGGAAVATLEQR